MSFSKCIVEVVNGLPFQWLLFLRPYTHSQVVMKEGMMMFMAGEYKYV